MSTGSTTLILGASGSGKSTLLSLLTGIVTPQEGRVEVLGEDFVKLSGPRRDRLRAEYIGVIFQLFNLLPYALPIDNILLPLAFASRRRAKVSDARAEALRLTRAMGLDDREIESGPSSRLSIGQQQRVAAARALIGAPPLIVADEPTSALDALSQSAFLSLLMEQVRMAGTTLVLASHDDRIARWFDTVVELEEIAQVQRGGTP